MSPLGFTGGIGNVVFGADDNTGVGCSSPECPVQAIAERPMNITAIAQQTFRTWEAGCMIRVEPPFYYKPLDRPSGPTCQLLHLRLQFYHLRFHPWNFPRLIARR